ncbi:hypothetical protein ACFMQL_01660 [Nonomuraea fastidiosa]|uniref:hypothetical protein n=1 Tax=Nonomuraea fastidiosa TaxID=46173 RepID=UPI00366B7C30
MAAGEAPIVPIGVGRMPGAPAASAPAISSACSSFSGTSAPDLIHSLTSRSVS